jgi:hypothetical protein
MRSLLKLVLLAGVVFGAYAVYDEFLGSGARALEGSWRSNKEASLREAARNGASEGQQALLARVFGKMVYEIDDRVWKARMDGREQVGTFEVLSKTGDCYSLQTNDGTSEVCLRDGRMYVSGGPGH